MCLSKLSHWLTSTYHKYKGKQEITCPQILIRVNQDPLLVRPLSTCGDTDFMTVRQAETKPSLCLRSIPGLPRAPGTCRTHPGRGAHSWALYHLLWVHVGHSRTDTVGQMLHRPDHRHPPAQPLEKGPLWNKHLTHRPPSSSFFWTGTHRVRQGLVPVGSTTSGGGAGKGAEGSSSSQARVSFSQPDNMCLGGFFYFILFYFRKGRGGRERR